MSRILESWQSLRDKLCVLYGMVYHL
jgi:hypothetical protein